MPTESKILRLIAVIITAIILCSCLASCDYRDTHVICVDDNTLKYNGYTYVRLTDDDPVVSVQKSHAKQVYVTEPYIPFFLSRLMHEDSLGTLAKTYMSDNGYFISRNFRGTYCRKDIYDNLEEILNKVESDVYMYEYYEDTRTKSYHLTEDEMTAVDKVFAEVAPVASYDLGYSPDIQNVIDILYFDNETETASLLHRLIVMEDGYCFTVLREDGITEYYVVPDALKKIFDSMTKAYTDALDY